MKIASPFRAALFASAIALFNLPGLHAQVLTFDVDINTAGLSSDLANAPFDLDMSMSYGNSSLASNTATLSNFVLTGGSATGSAVTTGTASGSLASSVSLTAASTSTYSDLYQQFSSGTTNINFQVSVTERGPDVGTPSELTIALLDNSLGSPAQIYTTAPDAESLLVLNLNSANTVGNVDTYSSVSSADGNTPINGVFASAAAIPEPATTGAILGGIVLLAAFFVRRSGACGLYFPRLVAGVAGALVLTAGAARAQNRINTVWYILLENRNFTQSENSNGDQIYGSVAAPYINSLITPGNPNSAQVSYCSAYHNALSVYDGSGPSIHPSEPNYVWMESGSNLSKLDDNDPYGSGQSVNQIHTFLVNNPSYSGQNLCGLIQAAGLTWRAYSEGTNELNSNGANSNTGGNLTATPEPEANWTVPLASFSGNNASYTNPYNGSTQWNFACKHTGSLFFADTNGTTSLTTANTGTYPTNAEAPYYSPLPDLVSDLNAGMCAQYNVITPDQFNDMHTALSGGFTYHGVHYTGANAQIAQADNFLSIVVPQILASPQYQNGGCIVIWTDETEGSNANDFAHTLAEIVISPLAKGNAYCSTLNYTHSSDLNTMQKLFQVTANTPSGFLNDAANPSNAAPANLIGLQNAVPATGPLQGEATEPPSGYGTGQAYDLSDLFQAGVIPASIPTVSLQQSGFVLNRRTGTYAQTATVTNLLSGATANNVYIEVANLPGGATLVNSAGTAADGNPYVLGASAGLASGASNTVTLQIHATGGVSDVLSLTTNGTP